MDSYLLSLRMSEKDSHITNSKPEGATARTSFPSSHTGVGTSVSANSSAARLAKRALRHPPAVSEMSLQSPDKEAEEYPKGWKLASITLALCCAVFVGTLVSVSCKTEECRAEC